MVSVMLVKKLMLMVKEQVELKMTLKQIQFLFMQIMQQKMDMLREVLLTEKVIIKVLEL